MYPSIATKLIILSLLSLLLTCSIVTLTDVHKLPSPLKSHSLLFSSSQQQQPAVLTTAAAAATIVTTTTLQPPIEVPDFVEPIGNHTVAVGRDAQLSCKITNLGPYKTAWLRVEDKGILTIHNNIITRNYRIGLNNDEDGKNFILTIKKVQPSDRGGYMCQINSVPTRYAIGYLDVLTPPIFVDDNNNNNEDQQQQQHGGGTAAAAAAAAAAGVVVAREGSNATLSCRSSGHPEPEIVWRREDNEPIRLSPLEEVPKVEGAQLALSSVSRHNSGAYLCIASNGVQPSASRRQVLDVHYKPVIRLPQTEIGAQLKQPEARLTCYASLNPAGSYHWVRLDSSVGANPRVASEDDDPALIEHEELLNSDKHEIVMKQVDGETVQMVLAVRRLERADFARYKCIARNSLGIQSNSIRLYEASSFSLNSMFRGGASGGDGGGSSDSTQPSSSQSSSSSPALSSSDQQLNDQQQESRPPASSTRPGSQYLSTRANSRSSWIQRSPAPAKSAPLADGSSPASSQLPSAQLIIVSLLLSYSTLILASLAQTVQALTVRRPTLPQRAG